MSIKAVSMCTTTLNPLYGYAYRNIDIVELFRDSNSASQTHIMETDEIEIVAGGGGFRLDVYSQKNSFMTLSTVSTCGI